MYPHTHFLFAYMISLALVMAGAISHKAALITGFLAVFIDIDHLIEYMIHERKFDVKNAWNNASTYHRFTERTFIHHKLGFVMVSVICVALFFLYRTGFYVLAVSYFSHMFLDHENLNILHLKKVYNFKEEGLRFKLSLFEILLGVLFFIPIVVMVIITV